MSRLVMQARATWRELPARVRRLIEVFGFVSLILVGLSFVGSREVQIAAIVGLFALFIVVQGLILLTLWRQHPEVRRARRLYMADLALAQGYAGQPEAAAQSLRQAAAIELEPHRRLMAVYLQARLSESAPDEAREDVSRYEHGLGLWRAEAERFGATPYGVALAEDIGRIEHLLAGGLHEPTEDLKAAP
jgi:hypothetical protein